MYVYNVMYMYMCIQTLRACQSCSAALMCIVVCDPQPEVGTVVREADSEEEEEEEGSVSVRREKREEKRLAIMMMTKKRRRLYEKVCLAAVTAPSQKYSFVCRLNNHVFSVCLLQIVKSRKKKAADVRELKRRRQEIDTAQDTRTTDT